MKDPEVGKTYESRGYDFRVDYIQDGEVYYVRFPKGFPYANFGRACRISLENWRLDMNDLQSVPNDPKSNR